MIESNARLTLARTALVAFSLLIASAADAQQPSDADLAKADDLYRKGNAAFEAGNLEAALGFFKDAFALKQSSDIAGNLGATEHKLGHDREAAEHLSLSLRIFPVNGKERARKVTLENLAEAKAKVGCFNFTVNADGAKIQLGDRTVGPTPIADIVCAYPATYTIRVERDGYEMHMREVKAEVGQELPVSIVLKPKQASGSGGAGASGAEGAGATGSAGAGGAGGSGAGEPDDSKPIWPAIVLGSVAAAGLGVGIGLTVAGRGKYGEAEDLIGSCAGPTAACVADAQSLLDDSDLLQNIGIAGFAIGGAAAIGTLIYLVVPGASSGGKPAASRVQLIPILGPRANGFSFSTSF